ncbi:hypothetical protein ACIBEK_12080 [Nocardia fusca]|uniref:hypothetical protein n=1 Tax=Nocardia fusca TaxID=941183 RepID=UPI0037AADDF1
MDGRGRALGLIRRDVRGYGVDIHRVAERFEHRIVWTLYLDTSPLVSAWVLTSAVIEHGADAVVVPGFEHADAVRHSVTDIAALITPMQVCPRGYRWPVVEL